MLACVGEKVTTYHDFHEKVEKSGWKCVWGNLVPEYSHKRRTECTGSECHGAPSRTNGTTETIASTEKEKRGNVKGRKEEGEEGEGCFRSSFRGTCLALYATLFSTVSIKKTDSLGEEKGEKQGEKGGSFR